MGSDNLSFIGENPGAVRYGNFINYYEFHPAADRINKLEDIWTPSSINNETCAILDVGCNSGELTVELHKFLKNTSKWKNMSTLGIDIDKSLIARANEIVIDNMKFECLDITSESDKEKLRKHLDELGKTKFDVISCFSVTMWIHLNSGDDGLNRFLDEMCSLCNMLILEPQPWKCYRTAVRRMKKSSEVFPLYSELKIRSNVVEIIEKIITKNKEFVKKFESSVSSWNRKILVFHRIDLSITKTFTSEL